MDRGLIINNLLVCMIEESANGFVTNEEYYDWLEREVGLSEKDMAELKEEGHLPLPYPEEEYVSLVYGNNLKGE